MPVLVLISQKARQKQLIIPERRSLSVCSNIKGNTQWTPDLIYFNNTEVKPSVNYYTQQLFGQNAGDKYLSRTITLSDSSEIVAKRILVLC